MHAGGASSACMAEEGMAAIPSQPQGKDHKCVGERASERQCACAQRVAHTVCAGVERAPVLCFLVLLRRLGGAVGAGACTYGVQGKPLVPPACSAGAGANNPTTCGHHRFLQQACNLAVPHAAEADTRHVGSPRTTCVLCAVR